MKWLWAWFQRRCEHDDRYVIADILEGDGPVQVKWCAVCGAAQVNGGVWRVPQARRGIA